MRSGELLGLEWEDVDLKNARISTGHTLIHKIIKLAEPKVVQEMLGHSTISMTLDTYSHIIPSMQKNAASKMNDLLKESSSPNRYAL